MAGPWDDYATPDNVAALVTSEAQRQGVDPQLALRVAHQESRLNPAAVSPKGAVGVMQLMPDTARGMGVDPTDLGDNIRGGVGYLKQQMDTFGDPKLAAAAYNAGPEAVRRHGGVPPYAETQHYVQAVAPGDSQPETPPWLDYAPAAPAKAAPAKPKAPPMLPAAAKAPVKKTSTPMDAVESYMSGLRDSVAGTVDAVANFIPGVGQFDKLISGAGVRGAFGFDPLHMQGTAFQRLAKGMAPDHAPQTTVGQYARTLGQFTPAAAMPGSFGARIANVVAPALTSETAGQVAHRVGANPLVEQIARAGGALVGGGLASVRLNPQGLKAPDLKAAVTSAKNDAYGQVEAAGDVIPQPAMRDLADKVEALVTTKAGPDGKQAYPGAFAMLSRLKNMASSDEGVSLPQLDTLRSDIYDAAVKAGDREAPIGVAMRKLIDQTITDTHNPDILQARDLNTRLSKISTIQDEVKSAQLRAKTTNSGQNVNNSIRQELRPLVDPTRNQQITNLSPDELAALTKAVEGSRGQNAMRDASNILRNRFLQGVLAIPTKGAAPVAMEVGGRMLNRGAENGTLKNVQNVLDLIASGGAGRVAPPVMAQRPPALSAPNSDAMAIAALISAFPALSAAKPAPGSQAKKRR